MTTPKRGRPKKIRFEDSIDLVEEKLKSHKSKWFLKSITWMDWEDVAQIIRFHLYKKWDMWDQKRPLGPWINTVISNQIKNLLRNHYGNFVRPCTGCPFNPIGSVDNLFEQNNSCTWTKSKKQDCSCPLFKKWTNTKSSSYHINMAKNIEEVNVKLDEGQSSEKSIDQSQLLLNDKMKEELNEKNYKIYKMLYIDNLQYEEIATVLGYKTNEKKRTAGYKQIKNYEKMFKRIAKKIISKYDIL